MILDLNPCINARIHALDCQGEKENSMIWKYPNGRTTREAANAEDSYELLIPGWLSPFWCPGTSGLEEAVQAFRSLFPNIHYGTVRTRRVLKGSGVGCMYVQESEPVKI